MNQQQQYEYIKATARPARRLLVKEVLGGFALTGNVTYHDRGNNAALMEVSHEGVAADETAVLTLTNNFFMYGQFDVPPLPLFTPPPPAAPAPTVEEINATYAAAPVPQDMALPEQEVLAPEVVEASAPEPMPHDEYVLPEVPQGMTDAEREAAHQAALEAATAGEPNVAVSETDGSGVI